VTSISLPIESSLSSVPIALSDDQFSPKNPFRAGEDQWHDSEVTENYSMFANNVISRF
jgi:hypothetical protein